MAMRKLSPMNSSDEVEGFRQAMRLHSGGVVMVTIWIDGRPWGLTISSCCSISAEPPQVLISLGSQTVTCEQVESTGRFGISLLSTRHIELAEVGAATGSPKFVDEYCEPAGDIEEGSPQVRDALYHLDCVVRASHQIADHTIFIGSVRETLCETEPGKLDPLIYFDRAYREVGGGLRETLSKGAVPPSKKFPQDP